jgi:hypothetical protein
MHMRKPLAIFSNHEVFEMVVMATLCEMVVMATTVV